MMAAVSQPLPNNEYDEIVRPHAGTGGSSKLRSRPSINTFTNSQAAVGGGVGSNNSQQRIGTANSAN